MLWGVPPGALLILGAALAPLFPDRLRQAWLTLVPIVGLWALTGTAEGSYYGFTFLDYEILPVRIDRLSLIFGYIFHIVAALSVVYAWHNHDKHEQIAAMSYVGSGIGAVFAGDLITLFVYWEVMAVTAAILIWARRTEAAYRAGMRYLVIQVGSGVLLMSGAILMVRDTGSLAFESMTLGEPGTWLILVSFGVKCAFPLLHNWVQDSYPEATVTGAVILSAVTTKCAVYALVRGFPGTELLIYVGAAMTAFPIFYAVIENDLRRVLSYSLNNQLGFMVCGVGVGSALAINGAVAHAFVHILYKALLFMSMGAVLYRTGTIKGSELGGLYKSMPLTAIFCIVGAASISAFPLFAGFVAKSLTLSAVAYDGYLVVWLVLLFASAGVPHYTGIKIPYFAFFAHDSGIRCKEAPVNMLIAMGVTAVICIAIGTYSPWLYGLLPHEVDYEPYTAGHVISQSQLLMFSALAFVVLVRYRIYPPKLKSVNIDFDITYRLWLPRLYKGLISRTEDGWRSILEDLRRGVSRAISYMFRHHGPEGILARTWPTGSMALWSALLLALLLVLGYV